MTTAQLRRTDPHRLDDLIEQAAQATVATRLSRKRYASATNRSRQRASCHRRGDAHSPATRFLVQVATAGGDAWAILSQAAAVVVQESIRKQTPDELRATLAELDDREHMEECGENRATHRVRGDASAEELQEAARLNLVECNTQLTRSAILRELAIRARRSA